MIVNLALSPAMILSREGIDAGVDADVADKEIGSLHKVIRQFARTNNMQ
jgi:hypothetical protein